MHVRTAVYVEEHLWREQLISLRVSVTVRQTAAMPEGAEVTLGQAVTCVLSSWQLERDSGALSEQTLDKFALLLERFSRFVAAHEVQGLASVDRHLAESFVHAHGRRRDGTTAEVANATLHMRRAVLRMFYRTARRLDLTDADPTRDIELPPRSSSSARPLTDSEVACLKYFVEPLAERTRHAAAVALALAGANTGEIGHITWEDFDADTSRIWVHGSSKTVPRWCPLDPWALRVLHQRSEQLSPRGNVVPPLATSAYGVDAQRQARSCVALRDALHLAGLGQEPDVKPASITAHAGVAAFAHSGHIEDAALRMGLTSLDRAAAMIGHKSLSESA